jgi:hypothetical protein
MKLLIACVLAALAVAAPPESPRPTFAAAGRAATATLLSVYYAGGGLWRACDDPACPTGNQDWGADSLTYALYLRWSLAHDGTIPPVMSALASTAPSYPASCPLPGCQSWSDVPQWDAIADVREYQVTGDPAALAKARAAFGFALDSDAFALGACPDIRYQQPSGGANRLKTLETEANAIKAALLLAQATHDDTYLSFAEQRYEAVRAHFLDPAVPLYSVYVFDDGTQCTQLPHRFFASVNGDMIWNGLELARQTGQAGYRDQALATARAVAADLSDPNGVFADLQAENDIAEPLVEAFATLAVDDHLVFARAWILQNAAAAVSARTNDGSYGRFFDGPPPAGTVTEWQTNGGLALEIAAAALDPAGSAVPGAWGGARRSDRSLGPTGSIRFTGSGIAILGTIGEPCCEPGHARVMVDGRETFDETGIWQGKSSLGRALPDAVLFAWRWPRAGAHTITFAPGLPDGKEGGSFLHVRVVRVRP